SMNYTGSGSRAMPATPATNAPTPWPTLVSRNSCAAVPGPAESHRRPLRRTATDTMRQIILDTETTGLEPEQGHRIVELACVEIQNRQVTKRHLHLYMNPDRDSDTEALRVHGLTTDFLSGHPRFPELAGQLIEFVRGAE